VSNNTTPAASAARLVISGNMIRRTQGEGILIQVGDSLTITGNTASSCGGHAGIDLRGVSNSVISGNVCNSNAGAGIELENQSGTFCLNNRVTGNTTRDDGTGIVVTTGAAQTQQHGIVEAGNSNVNLFLGNESDSNAIDQLATVGAGSVSHYNILSGTISS